jgi:hypothetical protein
VPGGGAVHSINSGQKTPGDEPGVFRVPIREHSPLLLLTSLYQLGLGGGEFLTELLQLRVAGLLHLLSYAVDQSVGALILRCLLDFRDHVGEVITSHFGTPLFTRGTISPLYVQRRPLVSGSRQFGRPRPPSR